MYFIELIATKKCNMNCYYCTTQREDEVEVDIDYLKWALDQCPQNLGVELTGGEIGLLTNLDEFYTTVKGHPHVKHIMVLSNGLVRQRGVDWLKEVEYWEHLIFDIDGKEIIKFYDLGLDGDHKYVIVTTEKTTKSLLDHWKYHKSMGMIRDNFYYKMMNHKSDLKIQDYFEDLAELYIRLDRPYEQRMLLSTRMKYHAEERYLCEKCSPNPFIDLQTKEIGHCAININQSLKNDFNKKELSRIMNGTLTEAVYCHTCHAFDDGFNRGPENNRSYKR
jgi:hypothetical protein